MTTKCTESVVMNTLFKWPFISLLFHKGGDVSVSKNPHLV